MKRLLLTDDAWSTFILRVLLGLVMWPHGAQKLLGLFGGFGFSATMGFFGQQGIPAPLAVLVIVGEFFGSLTLIVGLLTRVAAFGIACVMLGAVFLVHAANGFFMNWSGQQAGEGFEYHLLAFAICLALMIAGGGRLSVDRALTRRAGTGG
ncbi:MAG: DoxX family protein [Gemmatimonadetes bacterium]|nr:DoxX family protein [Gemmatimonadota bacterium]